MAFNIPEEDCNKMIGKDGGIAEGDAHLTNYRENANFFLDPFNPSNFEVVWNTRLHDLQIAGHHRHHRAGREGQSPRRPARPGRRIQGRARPLAADLQARTPCSNSAPKPAPARC